MQHFYQRIQGWSAFLSLYAEMVRAAGQEGARFVEIGAWRGRSTAYMAVEIINSGKAISFHVVDHWLGSAEHHARQEPSVVNGTLYDEFLENMTPLKGRLGINIHRGNSVSVAETFADASIDFLLIDGSHDYESVAADLAAWTPKMRPGAVIGGDDYTKPGVRGAAVDWAARNGIQIETFGGIGKSGFPKCWRVRVGAQ